MPSSLVVYRLIALLGFCVGLVFIGNVVVSLILTTAIRNGETPNDREVIFVQACNYLFAGLIFLSLLSTVVVIPVWWHYRHSPQQLLTAGLTAAFE